MSSPLARVALAVGLIWSLLIVCWPSAVFVLTFDDSFYYFEIARRIALGQGSTFDGLNPTNGYHPLWMLCLLPPAFFGLGGLLFVRAALLSQLLMLCAVVWRVGASLSVLLSWTDAKTERAVNAVIQLATVLVLLSPFVLKTFVNGLESAVYFVAYASLLLLSFQDKTDLLERSPGPQWRWGLLAALAFWARTDGVFLSVAIGMIGLFRRPPGVSRSLARLVGPTVVSLAAFLLFNQWNYGIPMQVSGELKRVRPGALGLSLATLVLLSPFALKWSVQRLSFSRLKVMVDRTQGFALYLGLVYGYYAGFQSFLRLWYFGPAVFYGALLGLCFLVDLLEQAQREAAPDSSPVRAIYTLAGLVLSPLFAGLLFQTWTVAQPSHTSIRWKAVEATEYIKRVVPADAVLASWDAGLIGYLSPQPVVNLDGVVNSPRFLRAARAGQTGPLLRENGVGWVVNHGEWVKGDDPQARHLLDQLYGDRTGTEATLVKSWRFDWIGTTNNDAKLVDEMGLFLYRIAP